MAISTPLGSGKSWPKASVATGPSSVVWIRWTSGGNSRFAVSPGGSSVGTGRVNSGSAISGEKVWLNVSGESPVILPASPSSVSVPRSGNGTGIGAEKSDCRVLPVRISCRQ